MHVMMHPFTRSWPFSHCLRLSTMVIAGNTGNVGNTNDFGSSGNTGQLGSNTGSGVGGTNDFGSSGNTGSLGSNSGGGVGGSSACVCITVSVTYYAFAVRCYGCASSSFLLLPQRQLEHLCSCCTYTSQHPCVCPPLSKAVVATPTSGLASFQT